MRTAERAPQAGGGGFNEPFKVAQARHPQLEHEHLPTVGGIADLAPPPECARQVTKGRDGPLGLLVTGAGLGGLEGQSTRRVDEELHVRTHRHHASGGGRQRHGFDRDGAGDGEAKQEELRETLGAEQPHGAT